MLGIKELSVQSAINVIEAGFHGSYEMKKYYRYCLVLLFVSFIVAQWTMPQLHGSGYSRAETKWRLASLSQSLQMFKLDNHRYPSTSEGLAILVSLPQDSQLPGWRQYMREAPKDIWGRPFVCSMDATGNDHFTVHSMGPDGKDEKGGGDDVVLWEKEYPCEPYHECLEEAKDCTFYFSAVLFLLSVVALVVLIIYHFAMMFFKARTSS